MDLRTFFTVLQAGGLTHKAPVILLRSNHYPLLLCSLITDTLSRTDDCRLQAIDLSISDEAALAAQCASTFLGERSLYWLYNLTLLDAAPKKRMEAFLANYQGPHCLVAFALPQQQISLASPDAIFVDIPDACDKELFLELVLMSQATVSSAMHIFAQQLFAANQQISFDTACLMIQYAHLLGAHHTVFVKHWLGNLVPSERSLFTLSQQLFAKNGRSFFAAWADFLGDYPELFWVSFWSEQLWRATAYIRLMQNNNRAEAEKVGHRLPFSFKNKQWSLWDPAELAAAHSFLQSADFALKNGGTIFSIELFYAKFFANDFAAK